MSYPKNLKYPFSDYKKLVEVLKQLAPYFELFNMQPNQVHYLAYQQTNKIGQPHNIIYLTDRGLQRYHKLTEKQIKQISRLEIKPIVDVDFELELYPNDCNDIHIETAVKRAIKELTSIGIGIKDF